MPSILSIQDSLPHCPDIGLLTTVFDAVPFATALIDPQGRLLHLNRAFDLTWGQARPLRIADLFHTDDRETFSLQLAACQEGSDAGLEVRLPQDNGSIRWAQVTLKTMSAGRDDGLVIAASFCEVTALKDRISELSAWESRWNNALVSSVTGVWDHDWATGQKYYSPTWRRIRGLGAGDPLPESTEAWLDLLHPDDRDRVVHSIARQNAGDPDYAVFEYRERHKDGHWIWIECRGDCVEWDEHGTPTRIVGTDTDITPRKLAEEAAARVSRRLEMALEISGVGCYECDLTTGVVDWDERMYRIYGLSRREDVRVGGLWEALLHPDDAGRVLSKVNEHLRDKSRFSDQYRVLLRDGSEHIIRARTMSFVDSNGHDMTVGANWDVTDDVRLHRELERAKILAEARNIELEAAKDRIEHSAMHDYLTELPNRRYLDEVLDRMSAECRRSGDGIAVLHIDLDRFKHVNDTLGHGAGDVMLRHTANVLLAAVRNQDFVARIGGDEFVVVMPIEDSETPVGQAATRIIEQLRRPIPYEGQECRVGASIGIASDRGRDIDVRQLLRNSDIALYQAKRLGRNRCVFFTQQAQVG